MSQTANIQVDEKLVREIATLARLDLSKEEIELFVSQFRDILDYVSVLNEVETEDIPPAYLSSAISLAAPKTALSGALGVGSA